MIATCPKCLNTGRVGENGDRYCSCEAAMALRARIDADPRVIQRRREIERALAEQAEPAFFIPLPRREDDQN